MEICSRATLLVPALSFIAVSPATLGVKITLSTLTLVAHFDSTNEIMFRREKAFCSDSFLGKQEANDNERVLSFRLYVYILFIIVLDMTLAWT